MKTKLCSKYFLIRLGQNYNINKFITLYMSSSLNSRNSCNRSTNTHEFWCLDRILLKLGSRPQILTPESTNIDWPHPHISYEVGHTRGARCSLLNNWYLLVIVHVYYDGLSSAIDAKAPILCSQTHSTLTLSLLKYSHSSILYSHTLTTYTH